MLTDALTTKVADFGFVYSQCSISRFVSRIVHFRIIMRGGALNAPKNAIGPLSMRAAASPFTLALRWQSPESLRAEHFSSRSDVWSFGVVVSLNNILLS